MPYKIKYTTKPFKIFDDLTDEAERVNAKLNTLISATEKQFFYKNTGDVSSITLYFPGIDALYVKTLPSDNNNQWSISA